MCTRPTSLSARKQNFYRDRALLIDVLWPQEVSQWCSAAAAGRRLLRQRPPDAVAVMLGFERNELNLQLKQSILAVTGQHLACSD